MSVEPTYLTENLSELVLTTPGFDDLLLIGTTVDDVGNEFHIKALEADATWDNPQPIDVTVQRWLTDGAVAITQGHDNRTPYFKVLVSAATSGELAAGEQALAQRAERVQRGESLALLTWIPAEGRTIAPASVFEVWTWHLEQIFDPSSENRLTRMYGIRATAKPWVRSENLTTIDAVSISSSPTAFTVDSCTSTTGWTGSPNAVTLSGGTAISEQQTYGSSGSKTQTLTRTGSVTGMGTTPYLQIDMGTGTLDPRSLSVLVDGAACTYISTLGTSQFFQVPAGVTSFTTLTISRTFTATGGFSYATLVYDVTRTNALTGVGTTKQITRSLDVGGSVPTSGSLLIASPSATALGTVLVYTAPRSDSGYSPPMRQYRTTGNTVTADSTTVSGSVEALTSAGATSGPITYTAPAASYREGTYAIVARIFTNIASAVVTATVTAAIQGFTADSIVGRFTFPATINTWGWAVIGALTLPPQAVPDESGLNMVVTLQATSSLFADIKVDELYLLDLTHGDVSLVDCGTATKLRLNAPDFDPTRNRPTVYVGTAADLSDSVNARYDKVLSLGEHDLYPEGSYLLTVTDGVGAALASGTFYKRWHTQPAE